MASGSAFLGATFVKAHGLFLSLRKNTNWESFAITKEDALHARMTPCVQGGMEGSLMTISGGRLGGQNFRPSLSREIHGSAGPSSTFSDPYSKARAGI